jgi:hypothetical protein
MSSKVHEKDCKEEIDIGPHLEYFSTIEFCDYVWTNWRTSRLLYYKDFKPYA